MPAGSGRFRIVFLGPSLGAGVSDGLTVSIHAVAKKNGPKAPYCVANEVVCGEIGRFLGLPVPPSGVVYPPTGNELFFASLDFNLTGNTLPPLNTTKCVQLLPELSAGVLLFDILIANSEDRKNSSLPCDFLRIAPSSRLGFCLRLKKVGRPLLGFCAGREMFLWEHAA